ncbi:LysR family transcriptional regulator, partial [Pseudomonas syringae]
MPTLKVGSEVFSAGSTVRPGGYSEFKVVDAAVLMSMALESKGVAWLPKSLTEQQVQEGRLVRALDESWDISLEIHLTR